MDNRLEKRIRESRKLLRNPYAYLNDEGGFDGISRISDQSVHESRRILQNPYAYLDGKGEYSEYVGAAGSHRHQSSIDADGLLGGRNKGTQLSKREVESVARNLLVEMWRRRSEIFVGRTAIGPLEILDPSVALRSIGYDVELAESLGKHESDGELFEIAGIIDNSNARVQLSRRFSPEIRNFTAAHELGHAVLHSEPGLHRDRALDGASGGRLREPNEVEADVFAALFLMPEKQIRIAFEEIFHTQQFTLNDATAFALTSGRLESLQIKCRTIRDLTRILSSAEHYDGRHFHSLTNQFCVSTEAMAIRLEELRLVRE